MNEVFKPEARLDALDGLRAVSIGLVMVSHGWLERWVPGGLGVTIFFFISGFIITRLMSIEYQRRGRLAIGAFYIRRFFRLMPALAAFMTLSLLFASVTGLPWRWQEVAAVWFYLANYYDLWVGFLSSGWHHPLSITWSLAIEEHFYLIFPSLFVLLYRQPRRFLVIIGVLAVLVLGWRLLLLQRYGLAGLPEFRIYKGSDTRIDSILYGCALSVALARYPQLQQRLSHWRWLLAGLALILLSLLWRSEYFRESWRYTLQGVALFMMTPHLLFVPNLLNRCLSLGWVRHLGRISYSLYLYHWLVLLAVSVCLPDAPLTLRLPLFYGLSLVLAEVSYRWIERPAIRLGHRLSSAV